MRELAIVVAAVISAGCLGLVYILSAFRASRTGMATGKGVQISKAANPAMFSMYVRGRYMSGATLIVVAIALAIVLRR